MPALVVYGTSPRGWGEGHLLARDRLARRNIPTRVGRSSPKRRTSTTNSEHPHAGGEKAVAGGYLDQFDGTSPRGWGEEPFAPGQFTGIRNIPTRVGRSINIVDSVRATSEHPHAGGEKFCKSAGSRSVYGTSPRGWGEDVRQEALLGISRNIPTRVGRSRSVPTAARRSSEHPHAGGEKPTHTPPLARGVGTSPRGWGEGQPRQDLFFQGRNIPTRVGRRPCVSLTSATCTEHPHAGGEKAVKLAWRQKYDGTSPRGWGEESGKTTRVR